MSDKMTDARKSETPDATPCAGPELAPDNRNSNNGQGKQMWIVIIVGLAIGTWAAHKRNQIVDKSNNKHKTTTDVQQGQPINIIHGRRWW